jgi:ATP-dependent DNA helicase PIF1
MRSARILTARVGDLERRNASGPVHAPVRFGSGQARPAAIDMAAFDLAFRRIAEGAPLVMALGGAGTGKTTFLHELRRRRERRQVFLAPTGVAALQLGGQTIHSFFGVPPRILNPDEVRPHRRTRKLIGKLERLVIDEVSMLRCDLLDAIDRCLRLARGRPDPFGGVQVVLVGDFLQLPPVVPQAEREVLARFGYAGPYAFDAKVLGEMQISRVPFALVHRQTEASFVDQLASIRRGERVAETIAAINAACCRAHRRERLPVVLAPTNARVDAYNARGLSAIGAPERVYAGETKGEFDLAKDRLPVPERLVLKVGARVMAVRNDPARRFVNGSVGVVMRLDGDCAGVAFDGGDEVEVERTSWERIRYAWNEAERRIEAKVVGSYAQLPLVHAWAATVHKAQGLTLDDVRIDFDAGAFAPGQAYVALSRARSRDGLSLARPLRPSDVRVDRRVAAFMAAFELDAAQAHRDRAWR